jgi:ParB-like nuclease domain
MPPKPRATAAEDGIEAGALKIAYVPIVLLKPYARNARTHDPAQIAQIAASIRQFGFTNPLLIDEEREIIAGHGRLEGARVVGMSSVPTITLRGLSPAQRRALRLADNRLALNAGWDDVLLREELAALQFDDFDISLLGFDDEELARLLTEGGGETSTDHAGNLSARFGVPPFSVLNAREGWWQDRKRAWISLGIRSELGRGEDMAPPDGYRDEAPAKGRPRPNAAPGGSPRPAADYSQKQRGDGAGKALRAKKA